MLVLDTDHVTHLGHLGSPESLRLTHRIEQRPDEMVATTIITYEEQFRGWMGYLAKAKTLVKQVEAYRRLAKHAERYRGARLLDFDAAAAAKYQELFDAGIRIGPNDLKIAAITLLHDATLLTCNFKDFGRVPGLRIEDWTV